MLKILMLRFKISVALTNDIVIRPFKNTYVLSNVLSWKVKNSGCRNVTTNKTMSVHNSYICNRRAKIVARQFLTLFPNAAVNKRICFSSFLFNKNDKNVCILVLVQLNRSVENEPEVVRFIARLAVCFVRPKRRKLKRPTIWCHKLENTTRSITIAEFVRFRNTFSRHVSQVQED